ncbi:hypothetical protein IW152_004960 [Coemansia sp. BCRC 34962]|nr:hypothetical protein IW152_004960 [Coemansia sp. BCRC 34962]
MSAQNTDRRQNTGSLVIETNPEQAPIYIYGWSSSEDVSNWSLTSLSTKSIDRSPAEHVVRRRRVVAARNETQQLVHKISAKRRMDVGNELIRKRRKRGSTRSPTRTRALASVRARRREYVYLPTDFPGTPEKLPETLHPSGSPARVSGTKVVADVSFTDLDSCELCKVDKSLVCKGFWGIIGKVGRICLPCRSRKTYNLTQLLLFFSLSPEMDYLEAMPSSMITETACKMDIAALCRKRHECLSNGLLLQTMHPAFYSEHFMKYPALHTSLSECKDASFGTFIRALCDKFARAIKKWLEEIEMTGASISIRARDPLKELKQRLLT